MKQAVEKAISEGRLRFYNNGKYSYKPSKEYENRFNKPEGQKLSTVVKDSIKKLDALDRAFVKGAKEGKRLSHVTNGKMILV